MNRWKGAPPSTRNMTPTPVPPPVITRPEPVAPPIQTKPQPLSRTGHPRTPPRLVGLSFPQKTMLAALLVTTGLGLTIMWAHDGEWNSIHTQAAFHAESDRLPAHPGEKPAITAEADALIAANREVTPITDESSQLKPPVVDDDDGELVLSLIEEQPARVDLFESEPSQDEVAAKEVKLEVAIAQTKEVIDASSEDLPESEVTESTIDSTTTAAVETILASYNTIRHDEPDLPENDITENDFDGQATSADQKCDSCSPSRKFGTAIEWAENVEQAAQLAKEHDKLVFLIQVSGNFAREGYT